MKHTRLNAELGDFDTPGKAEAVADQIEDAVQTELKAEVEAVRKPLDEKITKLEADVQAGREALADQIIRLKTLKGDLKADDEDAIKAERQYLLGSPDHEDDTGLPMARLVAEFQRLITQQTPSGDGTTAATENATEQIPGQENQLAGNAFLPVGSSRN